MVNRRHVHHLQVQSNVGVQMGPDLSPCRLASYIGRYTSKKKKKCEFANNANIFYTALKYLSFNVV